MFRSKLKRVSKFFSKAGKKKGISTIVANVLILMFTVVMVVILWTGLAPVLNVDLSHFDSRLSIVKGEYTRFDSANEKVVVQVESQGGKAADYIQLIITMSDGEEYISTHDAPKINERVVRVLDFDDYLTGVANEPIPIAASVAPIFIIEGRNVLGRRINPVPLPNWVVEDPIVYYENQLPASRPTGSTATPPGGSSSGGSPVPPPGCEFTSEGCDYYLLEDCAVLSISGGVYELIVDIGPVSGSCFEVQADNVVLDLNGHSVGSDGVGAFYGVYNDGYDNFELSDGTIDSFFAGVWMIDSVGADFYQVNISNSGEDGLLLDNVNSGVFSDIYLTGNGFFSANGDGINMDDCDGNSFSNIFSLENRDEGIQLDNSNNNNFFNIIAIGNNVDNNAHGVQLDDSSWNVFNGNNFLLKSKAHGIMFMGSSKNNYFNGTSCYSEAAEDIFSGDGTNKVDAVYDDKNGPGIFNQVGTCPALQIYDYSYTVSGIADNMEGCVDNLQIDTPGIDVDLSALGWTSGFPFYWDVVLGNILYFKPDGVYDKIKICDNGYIGVPYGTNTPFCGNSPASAGGLFWSPFGMIAPYWVTSDVDPNGVSDGDSLYYCDKTTIGGIKYLVVHWKLSPDGGTNFYEFEAHLYENGTIIFAYENDPVGFIMSFPEWSTDYYREIGVARGDWNYITRIVAYNDAFSGLVGDYALHYP